MKSKSALPSWGEDYANRQPAAPLPPELEAALQAAGCKPRDFGLLSKAHAFDEGFKDEAGTVVDPVYPDERRAPTDGEIARAMEEASTRTLQFICRNNATATEAGREALVELYMRRPCGTQAQLAAKLGVSPGRLSQILNSRKSNMSQCYQCDCVISKNSN